MCIRDSYYCKFQEKYSELTVVKTDYTSKCYRRKVQQCARARNKEAYKFVRIGRRISEVEKRQLTLLVKTNEHCNVIKAM